MVEPDSREATDTAPVRRRLPPPGCLCAVTLLLIGLCVSYWISHHVRQQRARLQYFESIGATVETQPSTPVWLHDLVEAKLGREYAVGFRDITVLALSHTPITNEELRHLTDLPHLRRLAGHSHYGRRR